MTEATMKHLDASLIRKNRILFQNYTRMRTELAYVLNPERASVAFEIVPALLSLNEPDLPGCISGAEEGFGIHGVTAAQDLRRVVHDYFPETKRREIPFQAYLVRRPVVESLFLIGSIGTVAQTGKSDFDYWVCVDDSAFSEKGFARLRMKTDQIAKWCQNKFGMEVHFFILRPEEIRRNDF